MPEAPTYTGALSILGAGGSQPRSTPNDFGEGSAEALAGLGQSLTHAGETVSEIHKQARHLENIKYIRDAETKFQDYFSTWLAAPENHNDLNVDMKFHGEAKKLQGQYEAAAPSAMAKQMLRERLDEYVSSRYASVAQHAAGLRAADLLQSSADLGDSDLRRYSNEVVTPGMDASRNLLQIFPARLSQNNQDLPPGVAKQLNDKYTADAAYAVMDRSPAVARKILELGTLDGHQRYTVERAIKIAEEARDSLNSTTLQQMGENRMAQAELGSHPQKFDLTEILPFTSSDHAQHLITQWNAHIDASNKAWDMYDESKSWNGPEQVKFLEDFESKAKADTANSSLNARVLPMITAKVANNVREYYRDPSGYMIRNNPAVSAAQRRIEQFPPPPAEGEDPYRAERNQARIDRDDLVLKYQNVPDQSVPESDRKRHWVVPLANQRVMSESEAESSVSRINTSSPQDALNVIMSEVGQHPGREAIAFNNLVHVPGSTGLRGDYWMVYKNQLDPDVKDLVGALQHAKQLRDDASSGDKMQDFEKAIDGDARWRVFAASVPTDNFQREEVVSGYRNGLITYALSQVQQSPGTSPSAAIKKGLDKWIFKQQAVISVGGQKMIVDRKSGDQKMMSDAEVADFGRRLSLAPQFLDWRQIATEDEWGRSHFPDLAGNVTEELKFQEMRRYRDSGYFKLAPDNVTATFYIRKRDGGAFEARDRDGKAFALNVQNLPKFETYRQMTTFGEQGGMPLSAPGPLRTNLGETFKPRVEKVGSGTERVEMVNTPMGPLPLYTGTAAYRTNWPVEPKWLQHLKR